MKKETKLILALCFFPAFFGCSIKQAVMNELSQSLGTADVSTVITGEEDPELLGAALPSFIKLYEIVLQVDPDNPKILLATSNAIALYAFAFVQAPASMLPGDKFEEKQLEIKRAKKLFLRARDYVTRAIAIKYPGFSLSLPEDKLKVLLSTMTKSDLPYLYYAGLTSMGAFTTDSFDMELTVLLPKIVMLLSRVLELDETYEMGGIHDFFIQYYGALPKELGGSEEKARAHYKKALEYSNGLRAGTYLALAGTIDIATQNITEFKDLCNKVLSIDVNIYKPGRLMNILDQRKAKWMLEHLDDYFLIGD
jgi:predicted anti-sigma-YlaC factor YlaD